EFSSDDNVMHDFRNYLSKHNVRYSESEIAENQDWIKRKIKQEVFMSTFGMQDGFKVLLEADPQVQKAIESVPQARALYQNARKIVAQRSGGSLSQPLAVHPPTTFPPRLETADCSAKIISAARGRVAQLGERIVRNDEVAGSIPVSSTNVFSHLQTGILLMNQTNCLPWV